MCCGVLECGELSQGLTWVAGPGQGALVTKVALHVLLLELGILHGNVSHCLELQEV